MRILVVDDDAAAREVLSYVLQAEGGVVTTAGSATAAFASLETSPPDVLLVDVGMPETNGFTFVEELRRRRPEAGGALPVAALTGYVSSQDRERAFRVGFQMYLVKPVDPAVLVDALKSLTSKVG